MKKQLLSIIAATTAFTAFAQLPVSTTPSNRKLILEEFTGITCTYCPDGHKKADQIIAFYPGNAYAINIHVGGYANPASGAPDFRTAFGTAIAGQSNLTGYPAGTVNRQLFSAYSQNTTTPGTAQSRGYWATTAAQVINQASNLNVALQGTIDAATNILTVAAEVYYTGNSVNPTNYFNLALVQDSVLGPQTGGLTYYPAMWYASNPVGKQYQHNKMLRHMITGQWGDLISTTTTGYTFAKTYTYSIPAQYPLTVSGGAIKTNVLLSKLKLVAFVTETQQNIISGNSGPITIVNGFPTGVTKYDASEEFSANLFPNPTSDKATLALLISKNEKVAVKMFNILGAEVFNYSAELEKGIHSIELDASNLTTGIYFVKIIVGNKITTEKLTVSK
ncbi:MAG: Omp28-related outer membrane protein [Bacteroidota bacterium]|nr:Omp28-related outer membrane protein [Bacteroidota bacterium]MDP3146270.1 Omp28-related outer membrane protein [Bacteroidota bacterium]MDP3556376.1 Omp28-related outer membrane protein [Bacteroidota bacterium]